MRWRFLLLPLPLLLPGCIQILAGAGLATGSAGAGAAAGWMATTTTVVDDADKGLVMVKPVVEGACIVEQVKPHTAKETAVLKAFCDNIPTTQVGVAVQLAKVVEALEEKP
jgi:hypothetical protein